MFKKIFAVLFILGVVVFSFSYIGESKAQIVVTDGLVSYWTLDNSDIKGDVVKDVWGKNDGTIIGKAKIVPGKIKEGIELDGASSYVDCGNDASLDLTDALTIEVWMLTNVVGEGGPNAGPLCKAESGVDPWNWQLRFNSPASFMGFQFNAGGSIWISVGEKLTPDKWYHITGTFDGKEMICYLNGMEKEKKAMPNISSGNGKFFIGQDGWMNVLDGIVDEVRVYDRALSADEVKHNYGALSQLSVSLVNKMPVAWGQMKMDY